MYTDQQDLIDNFITIALKPDTQVDVVNILITLKEYGVYNELSEELYTVLNITNENDSDLVVDFNMIVRDFTIDFLKTLNILVSDNIVYSELYYILNTLLEVVKYNIIDNDYTLTVLSADSDTVTKLSMLCELVNDVTWITMYDVIEDVAVDTLTDIYNIVEELEDPDTIEVSSSDSIIRSSKLYNRMIVNDDTNGIDSEEYIENLYETLEVLDYAAELSAIEVYTLIKSSVDIENDIYYLGNTIEKDLLELDVEPTVVSSIIINTKNLLQGNA